MIRDKILNCLFVYTYFCFKTFLLFYNYEFLFKTLELFKNLFSGMCYNKSFYNTENKTFRQGPFPFTFTLKCTLLKKNTFSIIFPFFLWRIALIWVSWRPRYKTPRRSHSLLLTRTTPKYAISSLKRLTGRHFTRGLQHATNIPLVGCALSRIFEFCLYKTTGKVCFVLILWCDKGIS